MRSPNGRWGGVGCRQRWRPEFLRPAPQERRTMVGAMCVGVSDLVRGQGRQGSFHFACTPPIARVPHGLTMAGPVDEKSYPIDVCLLGAEAIVHVPNTLAQLVQHTGGLQRRNAGFHEMFITGYVSSIFGDRLGCKPLAGRLHDQLMEQRPSYRASFALDITLCLKVTALMSCPLLCMRRALSMPCTTIASGSLCRDSRDMWKSSHGMIRAEQHNYL